MYEYVQGMPRVMLESDSLAKRVDASRGAPGKMKSRGVNGPAFVVCAVLVSMC